MAIIKSTFEAKELTVFKLIKEELDTVNKVVSSQVLEFDTGVQPFMESICKTSGKRVRPALSILVGGVLGQLGEKNIKIGAVFELIHMATLIHDDVIDEADTRRNKETSNAQWGNSAAVLLGDVLFSHALLMATEFDSVEVCRRVGAAAKSVCEGEVMQTQRRFDSSLTKEEYFEIIKKKTGALFAASAEISALISEGSEEGQTRMHKYGMSLGIAYQIYDDCIDLIGSEKTFGKTLGTDLVKGKLTLPLFYILERLDSEIRQQVLEDFQDKKPVNVDSIVSEEAFKEVVVDSLAMALEYLSEARTSLSIFDSNEYREGMEQVTNYVENLISKCIKTLA